jgi:putative DNA-binding protein
MPPKLASPPLSQGDADRGEFVLRLGAFLTADHPKLKCYMGEIKFQTAVRAIVASHPPGASNFRWYARHLADFLKVNHPWSRQPELAELAALDSALAEALSSPDAPVVDAAQVMATDADALGSVRFRLSPSIRRLTALTNVTSLWASLCCDEEPPMPHRLDAPQQVLIWRQGPSARFRLLGAEEANALDEASRGETLGTIIQHLADDGDPVTANARSFTYLAGWLESQLIAELVPGGAPSGNNPGRPA